MANASPVSVDPKWWDCPTLDTDEHLSESLGQPLTLPENLADVLETGWATEHEDALCRWFARLTHQRYVHVLRDNTYNSENDFSANFVFSVFAPEDCADWVWSDDVFIVVEAHLGGDVRGNYGPARVYRVNNVAESGFLDWVCGWYASPVDTASPDCLAKQEDATLSRINERLCIGYSSNPTSELRELLFPDTEPVWSERLGCFVARLADVAFPVKLEPIAPYYC